MDDTLIPREALKLHSSHKTYRVRQIPVHLDRLELVRLLIGLDHRLGPSDGIRVMSLARDLRPRDNTQTSTIMFDTTPSCFRADQEEWNFGHVGMAQDILIDVHFRGFTVLNDVPLSSSTIDCIAISGLGSHPFGSWKSHDPRFMWLRDQLSKDVSQIRSILWGYDTQILHSQSCQTIEDLAMQLIDMLKSTVGDLRATSPNILFLAHSLGGIILKQALVYLANGDEADQSILSKTSSILNFGVPTKGMSISSLRTMVQGQPNRDLVSHLEEGSNYLANLEQQYLDIALLRDIFVKSAYETKLSATVIETLPGVWERKGPAEILVKQVSAVPSGSDRTDVIPINEDHSRLVKFSEGDDKCHLIISHLETLACKAQATTRDDPWSRRDSKGSAIVPVWRTNPLQQLIRQYCAKLSLGVEHGIDEETVMERVRATVGLQFADEGISAPSDQAVQADRSTFEWLFHNESLRFSHWLEQCHGLYWIQGKPGSGKSTLMRFILAHPNLQQILSVRGEESRICISFFFNERGDKSLQSLEGLVRFIIGKLVKSDDCFREPLERTFLEMALSRARFVSVPAWDLTWLQKLLIRLLGQDERHVRIHLFLDALDECTEDKEGVVKFLTDTISIANASTRTKFGICFSSRPWPLFENKFAQCPGFQIHDHTLQDIRQFTQARLKDLGQLLQSTEMTSDSDQALSDIVAHISTKASGVFLWVAIVVKELGNATIDGITESRVLEILDDLPRELENLYDLALGRVHHKYRLESYIMLEVMLRANGDISLSDFICAVDCAMLDTADKCIDCFSRTRKTLTSTETISNQMRRIKTRCAGLIEMNGNLQVQFMHQTVKDYLQKPGLLQSRLGRHPRLGGQNGYWFWAKFELVAIHQRYEGDAWLKFDPNAQVWSTLQSAERTCGLSPTKFLGSLFEKDVLKAVYFDTIFPTNCCWVSFAWRARLRFSMFDIAREELKSGSWPRRSRLHLISDTVRFAGSIRQTIYPEKLQTPSGLLEELAKELLENGADTSAIGPNGLAPLDSIIWAAHDASNSIKPWQMEDVFSTIRLILARGGIMTSACEQERQQLERRARTLGLSSQSWMHTELSTPDATQQPKKKIAMKLSMGRLAIKYLRLK